MTLSELRLCYITDRHGLASRPLLPVVAEAVEAGVDLLQIREKDLATRDLLALVEGALDAARRAAVRGANSGIVVNDRLDVALASGAHGVHLGGQSMPVQDVRAALAASGRPTFWVGVSCHSAAEVGAAEDAGADYALLGPIFETASKLPYGPPLGLRPLEQATRKARIPVLALGGITLPRVRPCLQAGAAGVAGISIFQRCESLATCVAELRREIEGFFGEGQEGAGPASSATAIEGRADED